MRAHSEIEHRLLAMMEPTAQGLGLDIVRVRLTGARDPVLQVMAERPDGTMSVDDCARLSRRLSAMLDEADPIRDRYALEVSSPGVDRPLTRLKDFSNWAGYEARVELEIPVEGRKRFHGWIDGVDGEGVRLRLKDGGEAMLPLAAMAKARLVLTDELLAEAVRRGQAPEADPQGFDRIIEDEAGSAAEAAGRPEKTRDGAKGRPRRTNTNSASKEQGSHGRRRNFRKPA
jgi:ribosome maturation factor RimP